MDQAAQKEASTKATEFKNSGNDKFNNKNYKGAIVEYKKGLVHETNNPDLHANLAAAYIHLERFVDAEEHARLAINMRPSFHKGYMRAAKAAHGKCMTTLALKHLEEGLSKVVDENGRRELSRLKIQYNGFLSLQNNRDREMDFSSDYYQSDEDDETYSSDEEPEEEETPPPVAVAVAQVEAEPLKKETVPAEPSEPIKPAVKIEEPPTNKNTPQALENTKPEPKIPPVQRQKSTEKEVDKPPEKKPDNFLEMCKEFSKDPELKKRVEDFKVQLRLGGEAYLAGNYRRAAEHFRAAKDRVGLRLSDYEIDERQLQVIKYAHCAALINIGTYDELVRAIQALQDMKIFEFTIPAMYIQMAQAYYKLNRFKNAVVPLNKAEEIIENCPIFDTFTWPGTTETIQETTPMGIKNAINELRQLCKMPHKATAVCRLDNCFRNSTHIIPSDQIYFSDPDFVGFVRMICEGTQKCHIEFHISCWKSYKELISGVEKMNDKEMLGRRCLTTDCVSSDGEPSIVTTIEIFGPDGEVKSTNKLDPKAATDSKNAKKKKIKEKDEVKVPKPKKPKEKKVREEKKRHTLAVDGEEHLSDQVKDHKSSSLPKHPPKSKLDPTVDPFVFTAPPVPASQSLLSSKPAYTFIRPFIDNPPERPVKSPDTPVPTPPVFPWNTPKNPGKSPTFYPTSTQKLQKSSNSNFILPFEQVPKLVDVILMPKESPDVSERCPLMEKQSVTNSSKVTKRLDFIQTWRALEARLESLAQLRSMDFGFEKSWNPQMPFYGQAEEAVKWSKETPCHLTNSQDPVEVRDAKEFIFSYFMPILKDQGPLKQSDVDGLWKESAGDFCDITVVLPNLKSISELLNESTCFCLLEDYICLAEQMETAYDLVKTEVSDTVSFLMNGSFEPSSAPQTSSNLPDLIHPQKTDTAYQSSSEDEQEDYSDEESESEEEAEGEEVVSDEENKTPAISESPEPPHDSSGDVFETPCGDMDEGFVIPPPKPIENNNFDDEKFSLQKMLDEMSRIKDTLMKGSEETKTSEYPEVSVRAESPSDEGFSTPLNQSMSPPQDADQTEETAAEEVKIPAENEETEKLIDEEEVLTTQSEIQTEKSEENNDEVLTTLSEVHTDISTYNQESEDDSTQDRDKASQSDILLTEERQIQTTPLETKDRLSQTKDSDLYKELVKKIEELTLKLGGLAKKNITLTKELEVLTSEHKNAKTTFENAIQQLHNENQKNVKAMQDTLKAEFDKKELAFKQKEENLQKNLKKREEMYSTLHSEHLKLKKNMEALIKDKEEVNKRLFSALHNVEQYEIGVREMQKQMNKKLQQMQKNQLVTIKSFWESQINLLRKRCVEKISEMQSWFSMFPSEEVEDLPSWNLIKHNTIQWGEISKKVHAIEANFLKTYSSLESRIQIGEEVDLTQVLPVLPEEPTPLPLDKIHQEITAKHLKKITELSSLVISQQIEIKTSKEANQQIHQLVNSLQMGGGPRLQSPMTTAFGSLACQYSYPPQPLPVPAIPPNQDTSKSNVAGKLFQGDVQALLQESSKAVTFTGDSEKTMKKGLDNWLERPFVFNAFAPIQDLPPPNMPAPTTMPPPNLPAPNMPPSTMPPPPLGVAQNLLKTSSILAEKKDKPQPVRARSSTPVGKAASSSRESTPIPSTAATPSPTPEKVKKKKKKADAAAASVTVEVKMNDNLQMEDDWNVVLPKNAISKPAVSNSLGMIENKLRNKKKLLDKLQHKYPNSSLKELDEVVKLVREQNNGSLSGLQFDEIETRVDRLITKRYFQKSSTMGLDKFSAAAWAPVKQQENPTWSNSALEECTICLDSMGNEQPRTKVDCNHEFHTKCLRKWLNVERSCPLCKKFTTMPDEFPAL